MKKSLVFGALATLFSFGAVAETPPFDYVKFGYVSYDEEDGLDLTGYEIIGSKLLNDDVYLSAGYTSVSDSVSIFGFGVDLDLNVLNLGLGRKWDVSDTMSTYAQIDWLNLDVDASGFGDSEDGYRLMFGVRNMATALLELKAEFTYTDVIDGSTGVILGADYEFSHQFSVYGDLEFSEEESDRFAVGIRYSF